MRIESRPARLGLTAALLLLTILVVGLGGFSVGRKVASFQTTGLVAEATDSGLSVVSANEASDLEVGDIIVLVNGERALSTDELDRLLRCCSESELEVLRGDELVSASHSLPGVTLDWAYIVLALTGIAYLLIGLYTLSRQRSRPILLFHLWTLASAAVYLLTPLAPFDGIDRVFYLVDSVCRLLLPPLTLHFFLVFPTRPRARWLRRAIPWLYLPAAALLVVQLDQIFGSGRLTGGLSAAALEQQDRIELVLLTLFALAAAAVLGRSLLSRHGWEQGRQTQWIAFGVAGGYLPFLLLYVVPFSLELPAPAWLSVAATAPLALVPLSFAYALLRYRLWDVAVIARDVATYALTVLLAVLGFSLLSLLIRRGVPQDMVVARGFLNASALLVVGTLSVPVRQGIGAGLQRLQYRAQQSRRALERLGEELLHERDLGRLASSLLRELEEGLDLEQGNLFLVEGDRLVAVREEPEAPSLELGDVDASIWSEPHFLLAPAPLADTAERSPMRLSVLGYHYVFPLTVRERQVGLLYLGHHTGGAPLSSDDLALVRQLLNQAALAIENAQLLEQRRRQLDRVSELKQFSDEIIESSPAGIAVVDDANRIVTANGAFAALVEHDRNDLAGRTLGDLIPLELFPKQGDPPVEVRFEDSQEREQHMQLSVAEFLGAPHGHRVVVAHDITEREAMKRKLAENERLAAIGAIAAGVAHEVNTPLTGISSYAQMLLAETPDRDPRRRLLRKVERQTFRAARIVNTLLDFARRGRHEPAAVDMGAVIQESCDMLAERFAETGVEVHVDLDPAETVWVLGNDTELGQVLANLMANAVDAMTEAGCETRRITLAVRNMDGQINVFIDDTGPGIREQHLERVFEPFFSTRKASGGTGLGLSISQEIVRRHGGDLTAANLEPAGCRFTVRLPQMVSSPLEGGGAARPAQADSALPARSQEQGP
ncbi:MAG: ATP-binding protein [Acidobacteria bacterium]|nr:ATP-binding protein [Acidobacteriota bacterium]